MSSVPRHDRPYDLRCEHLRDPEGIDVALPRLSWLTPDTGPDGPSRQVGYRIIVGSSLDEVAAARGDLWDSGRVAGDASVLVEYGGAALRSRQQCWWRVATWPTSEGERAGERESEREPRWSDIGRWSMGLLEPDDWSARWIAHPVPVDARFHDAAPVVRLRRSFAIDRPLRNARAYVTALGLYRLHLNGAPVDSSRLDPGWTDYRRRVQYRVHDVTDRLRVGENAIGAELGEGWYCGFVGPEGGREHYGTTPQLLVQLELDFGDGTRTVLPSDEQWRGAVGPQRWSDLLMGECFDGTVHAAQEGWSDAGFGDARWAAATVSPGAGAASLVATMTPPVRVTEHLTPVNTATGPAHGGGFIFDLGQNIVGWARLSVPEGVPAGTELTLRYAEVLDADGALYTANLRGARALDHCIAAGGPLTYEPTFSLHGFRYVELSGWPHDAPPSVDAVTGLVVHSDLEQTGTFATSSALVDRIFANTVWGQRGNFVDIPTDCPQRDERLGWLGDAQVFAGTAAYTMDVASFFTKWLTDVDDARDDDAFPDVAPRVAFCNEGAPAWGDAGVIVPWTMYERYGDRRLLARQLPGMKAWVERIASHNPDGVWANHVGNDYGDWLCIDAIAPKRVVSTAFFARSAALVAAAARGLEEEEDAGRFDALATDIAAAFRTAFIGDDGAMEGDTQTGYALALRFGLVDGEGRDAVAARLVADVERRGHLTTGFVGVKHLLPALTDAGRIDLAYRLLVHEGYPSWGYSIAHGATTMWERWDGWTAERGFQDPIMNSFNHYAFGAVTEWFFDTILGIRPDEPGFRRVRLAPRPGGTLQWAEGSYRSVRGPIRSRWHLEGDEVVFDVDVPSNAAGELVLPPECGAGASTVIELSPGPTRIKAPWSGVRP